MASTKVRQVLNLLWEDRFEVGFDEWVVEQREAGRSWREIEREIDRQVGVEVSNVTLSRWFPEQESVA